MSKLEIFVTGSSRPQLWPFFWESVRKMCIIRDWPVVKVHEDVVFPAQSKKVEQYVKEQPDISNFKMTQPNRGLGKTLTAYFKKPSFDSKYVFYLQEDWEFERPIDIDKIIWVMDQNPKMNCVFFNKIKNSGAINGQKQTEHTFSGERFCLYHAWPFLPGIWRVNFVRQQMIKIGGRFSPHKPEGSFVNSAFGSNDQRANEKYCIDNMGCWIYGRQGEHRYVRHLGNDWRMADWQRRGNQPGGNHRARMDVPYMAPWVPYLERPTSRGDLDKKEG